MANMLRYFAAIILTLARLAASKRNALANPLSIPASEYWEGNDGWWSTFWIEVGTPRQAVRVLPGTSASAADSTWVVTPRRCNGTGASYNDCVQSRGQIFNPNASSSWTIERPDTNQPLASDGHFYLNTIEEGKLGLSGTAYYGFDTIQLGLEGGGLPSVPHQVIAGLNTTNYWLGSLGLSPFAFNFTSIADPLPSLLSTLRDEGHIPSISWAYTAGAYYHDPPSFGSLTLGGYDLHHFDSKSALYDIPFYSDISRDLLVSLTDLTYASSDGSGSGSLMGESVYVFIDSMVSQMWLPLDVCDKFERVFDLSWDDTTEAYLISEAMHSKLLEQNPTFTFKLSSHGQTVDIVLPYAAFDLNLTEPLVEGGGRYFPLKRAQEEDQYTLGRVFLQEAYIIADYTRSNFTVAQARHPYGTTDQAISAILEPGVGVQKPPSKDGLSAGAIAGIVVGAVVILTAVILGLFCKRHRKQRPASKVLSESSAGETISAKSPDLGDSPQLGSELGGSPRLEMGWNERLSELPSGKHAQELQAYSPPAELEGTVVK